MPSILQISNKPLKNTNRVKQSLVKNCWEETNEKKTISCSIVK